MPRRSGDRDRESKIIRRGEDYRGDRRNPGEYTGRRFRQGVAGAGAEMTDRGLHKETRTSDREPGRSGDEW